MMTNKNIELSNAVIKKYLGLMIGRFYKILPIKEDGEPSLIKYMESFQREMLGCKSLVAALNNDGEYLTLLSILQYLIDNDCSTEIVRSEVFKAIRVCEKLQERYAPEGV